MEKGTGFLDIAVAVLPTVLSLLPKTYDVVGSHESSAHGVVRLKVQSEMLVGDDNRVTCEVRDAGSTRKVMILPA